MNTDTDSPRGSSATRNARLSKDGKWRSFPKVPHLLQYVSSGIYYARTKVNGKIIRHSLHTSVWTTAKVRLVDFLKEQHEQRGNPCPPSFAEAVQLYELQLEKDTRIKPQSKQYRGWCIRKIKATWPQLWDMRIDEIDAQDYRDWAAQLSKKIACHYYNNTIATLRQIVETGIEDYRRHGGKRFESPVQDLPRLRIRQKELQLPEPDQFRQLIKNLRNRSGGWGPRVADLIEFLAYSGMRIKSEALWVNWEDVDWQRNEIVIRGDPDTGTKNSELRRIPIIHDMEDLLNRLRPGPSPHGPILRVTRANEALLRACSELGIPRLTHHDFRHLFATRCIESGVDIPTVARWMGHKDGGTLAMRTYGHLRNEHSQAMAQKVRF